MSIVALKEELAAAEAESEAAYRAWMAVAPFDYANAARTNRRREEAWDRVAAAKKALLLYEMGLDDTTAVAQPAQGPSPENILKFARWVVEQHTGSIDGWETEDKAVELGLMERVEATEPCGPECECISYGFPTDCYRSLLPPENPNG